MALQVSDLMEGSITDIKNSCDNCANFIKPNAKFCHQCGKKVHSSNAADIVLKKRLPFVFGYYFTTLAFIVLIQATEFQKDTSSALISDALFAIITICFVVQNLKEIIPLFSFKNVKLKIVLILIIAEIFFAFGVSLFADFINQNLFDVTEMRYYYLYEDSFSPFFFTLLSIAVFPAIFEELGFRGVLFNHLIKITSIEATIIVTSALFAIIHLSLISLIWILPLGFTFAFLRNKYKTLWYGIIGHFVYNGFIVTYEFLLDGKLF